MTDILNKNLELIKKYNKSLAEKIINHNTFINNIELTQTDSGDYNLLYNNIAFVHDAIDPIFEAIEVFEKNFISTDNHENTIYMMFGLGLGYTFKRFAKKHKGKIIIIEPDIDILRATLQIVDYSEELTQERIILMHSNKDLNTMNTSYINLSDKVQVVPLDFHQKTYKQLYESLIDSLKQFNKEKNKDLKVTKINIGAGKWKKEGWATLDCYIDADINVDLRRCQPIPLKDNSLDKVFSSHCIEHIETPHIEYLAKELYRCMKSGAILRLACPDADLALEAYKNNDLEWFNGIYSAGNITERLLNTFVSYECKQGGPQASDEEVKEKFNSLSKDDFIEWCLSLCDRSRPYIAHINGIYFEKLEKILKDAGFINITKSSYKNSNDTELRGVDFDMHPTVSLFVECYKP